MSQAPNIEGALSPKLRARSTTTEARPKSDSRTRSTTRHIATSSTSGELGRQPLIDADDPRIDRIGEAYPGHARRAFSRQRPLSSLCPCRGRVALSSTSHAARPTTPAASSTLTPPPSLCCAVGALYRAPSTTRSASTIPVGSSPTRRANQSIPTPSPRRSNGSPTAPACQSSASIGLVLGAVALRSAPADGTTDSAVDARSAMLSR